jgi:hypothetical protein
MGRGVVEYIAGKIILLNRATGEDSHQQKQKKSYGRKAYAQGKACFTITNVKNRYSIL